MKQIFKSINPKKLFKSYSSKSRSQSLSESSPPSFGSASSSSATNSSLSSDTTSNSFKFDVVSAFQMIDRDGDGKIDRHELKSLFNKSLTESELNEMIKEIDRDGDGCISLDELQAVSSLFESTAREEEEDELLAAFHYFDTNHDGQISAIELFQGFLKLGDHRCSLDDCKRMIESVDVNRDGFVCFQDFSRMMDVIPR